MIDFLETYPEFACQLIEEAHDLAQHYELTCYITLYKKKAHILHELTCNDSILFQQKADYFERVRHFEKLMFEIGIIIPNAL